MEAKSAQSTKIRSMDEIDREKFAPAGTPLEGDAIAVELTRGDKRHGEGVAKLSLDGAWELAMEGAETERLTVPWTDAIAAEVPGSVHTALLEAGIIPDPYVGQNDRIAKSYSFKTWWLRKTFEWDEAGGRTRLLFGGVCDSCAVWLNGRRLGEHKGMFGGPDFEVGDLLRSGANELVVRLDPAPYLERTTEMNDFFNGMNVGWLTTAVFNNVYGWHYIDLPALGIWRSVTVERTPDIEVNNPFIGTIDASEGLMRLNVELKSDKLPIQGELSVTIAPDNFKGEPYNFIHAVSEDDTETGLLFEFHIPAPRLWWPNGLGEHPLYKLEVSFSTEEGGATAGTAKCVFGIRTIEMRPTAEGPREDWYNWIFVVNGKPMFVKGANWCTLDALMRFERERYDRFLTLAEESNIQLLRAWGSGMPETDDFYELADRKGLMVIQEWPTAWDSDRVQPFDILEETAVRNTLRLRNHPSLVMWGGGNESADPTGPAIDMFGKLAWELDGTRPFHRGEAWGGSRHNYEVYWSKKPLDRNLSLAWPFIGEFGLASMPNLETVLRYLPENERDVWPAPEDGTLIHRTPVFNLKWCMDKLLFYSSAFTGNDSIEAFVTGTQLAQATGVRHTLELARSRWPESTGIAFYKLNDNNPAASWSTVDWHGIPKLAYYFIKDAYEPLHAAILLQTFAPGAEGLSAPVYLFDDAGALKNTAWEVTIRAFDKQLAEIARTVYKENSADEAVRRIGTFELSGEQTDTCPLLLVTELRTPGAPVKRSFSWLNFEQDNGCLFRLPEARLSWQMDGDRVEVVNVGDVPAVAVRLAFGDDEENAAPEEQYFWLDAGETKSIRIGDATIVGVTAWNTR
ncbi:glycoside hydrolase family 2 protein [Cohnella sp. GCM10020058]|uniref:glycoside hydrolase family 2 protein n=1 Tax=Cohnella sp. GCM10020058 TaxID=3317330 RepID=UPI00363C4FBB